MPPAPDPPPSPRGNRDSLDGGEQGAQSIGKRTRSRVSAAGQSSQESATPEPNAGSDTGRGVAEAPQRYTAPRASRSILQSSPLTPCSSRNDVLPARSPSTFARSANTSRSSEAQSAVRTQRNRMDPGLSVRTDGLPLSIPASRNASSPTGHQAERTGPSSTMSPPRPTRSLPRRSGSAMTASRPHDQTPARLGVSPYALRPRGASSSHVLSSANSTANILASGASNRGRTASSSFGCEPASNGLGLGGDWPPSSSSSGATTPRTPLAEIPLWLADMRSESRRATASSSSSTLDPDDLNGNYFSVLPDMRRSRTPSASGSSDSGRQLSPSMTMTPRGSLRDMNRRESDENIPNYANSLSDWAMDDLSQTSAQAEPSSQGSTTSDRPPSPIVTRSSSSAGTRGRRPLTSRTLSRSINTPLSMPLASPQSRQRSASAQIASTSRSTGSSAGTSASGIGPEGRATRSSSRLRSQTGQQQRTNTAPDVAGPTHRHPGRPDAGQGARDAILVLPLANQSLGTPLAEQEMLEPPSPSASSTMTSMTYASTLTDGASTLGTPTPSPLGYGPEFPLLSLPETARIPAARSTTSAQRRSTRSSAAATAADEATLDDGDVAEPDALHENKAEEIGAEDEEGRGILGLRL